MIMTKRSEKKFVPEAISASLLKVGTALEEQGKIHQALPPYLKLVEHYSDCPEAEVAAERVLAIADLLRNTGHHHVALTVLDRLEMAYHAGREEEAAAVKNTAQ
jgi:TolA-binding protein